MENQGKCLAAKKCGGCQYQGIVYAEQLKKKQKEEEVRKRVEEWSDDIRDTQEQEMMIDWCESMGLRIYKKNTGKTKKILVGDEESGMYYWDEIQPEIKPVVKKDKVYPNDPCPCGSGKKYKKCCGRK